MGRPKASKNCTFLTWNISTYDEECDEWKTKKYFSIAEYEKENNTRLKDETVRRLQKRDQEYDPEKKYSPKAFWTKYKNIKLEKIHEKATYLLLRI